MRSPLLNSLRNCLFVLYNDNKKCFSYIVVALVGGVCSCRCTTRDTCQYSNRLSVRILSLGTMRQQRKGKIACNLRLSTLCRSSYTRRQYQQPGRDSYSC